MRDMASLKIEVLVEEEAERLRKLFSETKDPRFEAAAEFLIRRKPGKGRRAERDDALLYQMAKLIKAGVVKRTWPAACRVARTKPGHSFDATAKRLNAKFTKHGSYYLQTLHRYETSIAIDRHRKEMEAYAASLTRVQAEMDKTVKKSGLVEVAEKLRAQLAPLAEKLASFNLATDFRKFRD